MVTPSLWLSLCNKRRRRHVPDATDVEIVRASFVHEVDDDAIDTTRVAQSIHAMAGFRDDDVAAVRQIFCDFLAALRWRDRVKVTRKDQHRKIRRNRLSIIGRNVSALPQTASARLLIHAIIPERI